MVLGCSALKSLGRMGLTQVSFGYHMSISDARI